MIKKIKNHKLILIDILDFALIGIIYGTNFFGKLPNGYGCETKFTYVTFHPR